MKKGISRSKKWLLTFSIICLILVVNNIITGLFTGGGKVYRFSLFSNISWDSNIFAVLWLTAPFLGFLIAYILAGLFLRFHKLIFQSRVTYGIEERPDQEQLKFDFQRLFFPALMSVNFGLMFSEMPAIQNLILNPEIITDPGYVASVPLYMLVPIMGLSSIFSLAVFGAIYFLIDSGVVFANKKKLSEGASSTEVKAVGSWFSDLLKGYTGITVIINYYNFISNLISTMTIVPATAIGLLILWPAMPFILVAVYTPLLVLLFNKFKQRKDYILNMARKMGISSKIEIKIS